VRAAEARAQEPTRRRTGSEPAVILAGPAGSGYKPPRFRSAGGGGEEGNEWRVTSWAGGSPPVGHLANGQPSLRGTYWRTMVTRRAAGQPSLASNVLLAAEHNPAQEARVAGRLVVVLVQNFLTTQSVAREMGEASAPSSLFMSDLNFSNGHLHYLNA
jgi:hypothetical protein